MLTLNALKPSKGANRSSKRRGRGIGSGNGKTAGRGHKGAGSRSGTKKKLYFVRLLLLVEYQNVVLQIFLLLNIK